MVRMDLTTRIRNAVDLAECDAVAAEIVAARPDQLILLFAELHQRRSVVAKEAGNETEAEFDGWVATLLHVSFRASLGQEIRILPEAGDNTMDPLDMWRPAAMTVFEQYWQRAQDDPTPDAVKAILLQGLWEIRPLWQHGDSEVLPRPIDVLPNAVRAHVDSAKWIAQQEIDAATRGMLAARHWATANVKPMEQLLLTMGCT